MCKSNNPMYEDDDYYIPTFMDYLSEFEDLIEPGPEDIIISPRD